MNKIRFSCFLQRKYSRTLPSQTGISVIIIHICHHVKRDFSHLGGFSEMYDMLFCTHTTLEKGSFLMSKSVLFWYLRISRSATVPGR